MADAIWGSNKWAGRNCYTTRVLWWTKVPKCARVAKWFVRRTRLCLLRMFLAIVRHTSNSGMLFARKVGRYRACGSPDVCVTCTLARLELWVSRRWSVRGLSLNAYRVHWGFSIKKQLNFWDTRIFELKVSINVQNPRTSRSVSIYTTN